MRDMVKWKDADGVARYGLYRNKIRNGKAEISDAVLPAYHIAAEKDLVDIECKPPIFNKKFELESGDEYSMYIDSEYKKAKQLSDKLGKGIKVGKLFSISVADGRAYYVVTKVGKTQATVEWRGFCRDRYTDAVLGFGGQFPLATIKRLVAFEDGLKAMFG